MVGRAVLVVVLAALSGCLEPETVQTGGLQTSTTGPALPTAAQAPTPAPVEDLSADYCVGQALRATGDDLFDRMPAVGGLAGYAFGDENAGTPSIDLKPWGRVAVQSVSWSFFNGPSDYGGVYVRMVRQAWVDTVGGTVLIEGSSSATQDDSLERPFRQLMAELFGLEGEEADDLWADFQQGRAVTSLDPDVPAYMAARDSENQRAEPELGGGSSGAFAVGTVRWGMEWQLGFRLPVHTATRRAGEEAFQLRVSLIDQAEWWRHGDTRLDPEALQERLQGTFQDLDLGVPSVEERETASQAHAECTGSTPSR